MSQPDQIIEELVGIVSGKHLLYERKGFSLRISVCDDWGRVKLAFDLEVVQLKTKQLGIRKKRVKGDTWHYKKYCEDVIRSVKCVDGMFVLDYEYTSFFFCSSRNRSLNIEWDKMI